MKKVLSLILVLCMVAVVLPMSVSAANANGTVGSCVWKLEGTKLTISGNGSTGYSKKAPWGTAVTDVVVEEGVTDLFNGMFSDHTNLRSVKLPSTLKTINHSAFSNCTSLTSIEIPEGVVTIGGSVFYNCTSLVEITLSKTVSSIDYETFTNCYSLVRITVDENNPYLTSEGGVLFNKSKTTLMVYPINKPGQLYNVPESVTFIEYKAFSDNNNLINVNLHDHISRIGINAFHFTRMYFSSSNHYNGAFYMGDYLIADIDEQIANFTVREGTKLIADGAFTGYSAMTSITIPEGVESIGDSAFTWCKNLSRVTLPKSLTYIGDYAFEDCDALKNVYYRGTQSDRSKIFVCGYNTDLTSATWTYNACVNAAPHKWGETVVKKVADCITDGEQEKTCLLCKTVSSETIPATGHSFGITSQTKAPTCIEAGIQASICSTCNHTVESAIAPVGHVFGQWVVESEATCTGVGIEKRTCTLCDGVEARNIEAIGHDYGEFAIVTEATAEQEGSEQAVCKTCGDVQTRTIPKPETTPAPETTPEPETTPVPETTPAEEPQATGIAFGGVGMLIAFVAVVVIAGAVITALLIDKFKKRS